MGYIIIFITINLTLIAAEPKKYVAEVIPKKMSVKEKKARYYALVNPAVQKVYDELMKQYRDVKKDIQTGKNKKRVDELKEKYKVSTDKDLLLALKPHPPSVVLAQGAMESSWATSRFFVKAKNVFGMWSVNPHEPRIAANQKREGTRTIWLKKFASIEESVRAYYKTMGRAKPYKEFRKVRYETDNPFIIVEKLDKYSEIGKEYPKELASMIRFNKLTRFDK